MYVNETHSGEFGCAIGDDNRYWCDSESPDGKFICTLNINHTGNHIAGVDLSTWVAEWDDNRSTDTQDEFFSDMGL